MKKLAIIYDPEFPKLTLNAYSQTYRDMLLALIDRYEEVQPIHENCSAQDIEADHIIFFDIHSCHNITIDGIEKHKATKFEYFNDPYQKQAIVNYRSGTIVTKMGPRERSERANRRGVQYVICPQENMYYKHIAPHFHGELLWFPPCPRPRVEAPPLLSKRRAEVLANGHCWQGEPGFRPYQFRSWASVQDGVTLKGHAINSDTPDGNDYQKFLSGYAAVLALCDTHIVPKYQEIPLSGCLVLAQWLREYEKMGFQDGHHCLYVTKKNFADVVRQVKADPAAFQAIANNGHSLALNHWTARHFAEAVYGTH